MCGRRKEEDEEEDGRDREGDRQKSEGIHSPLKRINEQAKRMTSKERIVLGKERLALTMRCFFFAIGLQGIYIMECNPMWSAHCQEKIVNELVFPSSTGVEIENNEKLQE